MIMASSHRQSREMVLVENPEWKRGNIGYIDPTDPVKMVHGRQYYLIHWEKTSYHTTYVDSIYVHKMEDISKTKRTQYSPNEVRISPEQHVSLEGLRKDRALGRRLFKESSSWRQRIVEEGETFELSIDPFAEVLPEETGQKRSPKPPPQHEVWPEETGQKRSPKPPLQQRQQAGEKRSTKRPPQEEGVRLEAAEKSSRKAPPDERVRLKEAQERFQTRLQAAQKRSSQVGKEDVQASKPLLEESKKSPTLQETSKQAGEKRSTKRPPQEEGVRLEAVEKSSRKGPPDERLRLKEAQKRLHNPPLLERQKLQAAQKRSSQVGKEDVQASKPLPEESKKSPALQETSKQSSRRRQLITEEDDEMFSCNFDPFSAELVDRFEAQVENEAAESDQSSQENCF